MNILFVCTGNTCRSPMAAALMKRRMEREGIPGKAESAGLAAEPVTLGENEYFVLGDNRNDSTDSRDPRVGNITRDIIVGKAFVRIYPFDAIGFLKHQ